MSEDEITVADALGMDEVEYLKRILTEMIDYVLLRGEKAATEVAEHILNRLENTTDKKEKMLIILTLIKFIDVGTAGITADIILTRLMFSLFSTSPKYALQLAKDRGLIPYYKSAESIHNITGGEEV